MSPSGEAVALAPSRPGDRQRRDRPSLIARLWTTAPGTFSPGLLEIVEAPAAPIKRAVLCTLAALLMLGFAWSWFGRLSVYADAPGRIQAIGRSKVIEPQRTGTVLTIEAHDGNTVKEGDVLVRLDPTTALAAQAELAGKLADLTAEMTRWPVELAGARGDPVDPDTLITWPDSTPQAARAREQDVLRADLARLAATLANLQAQRRARAAVCDGLVVSIAAENALIASLDEHLGMVAQLEREGWNSHAYLLQMQAAKTQGQIALSALEGKLADARAALPVIDSEMVAAREALTKAGEQRLAIIGRDVDDLTQKLAEATQTVAYMTLRSPTAGTVQSSTLTTVGQVVKPGQQLMQVVPEHSTVEIEAYVPNSSIGFISQGQPVDIKVDTYLYTSYGTVPGTITRVAHNALALLQRDTLQTASLDGEAVSATAAQNTAGLVYPITVVAGRTTMKVDGREMPLTPGMTVTVDVMTERRRVLDYVLSPLIELFSTAAHEH